jgi:hypothetical protein
MAVHGRHDKVAVSEQRHRMSIAWPTSPRSSPMRGTPAESSHHSLIGAVGVVPSRPAGRGPAGGNRFRGVGLVWLQSEGVDVPLRS